jgi:chaperone modulatory protein CbpM
MARTTDFEYTFSEFCHVTRLPGDAVRELVGHGVVEPFIEQEYWYFSETQVIRCLKAERMRRDLDLDLHAVVLALELMDRNQRLSQRIHYLEQILGRLSD